MTEHSDDVRESDVAIIGMACRFPGAENPDAFWSNLREGRESTTYFTDEELLAAGADPAELALPGYVRAGQVLPGVELFDAEHFTIPADEAEILDPQHRLFLECALTALEDSGYDPSAYPGDIGLFAGAGMNTYLLDHLAERYATASSVGRYRLMLANDKDFLATRVSYKLNLRGPSLSVNTACSTSLVAVHQACLSLLAGECEMALAGAVHLRVPQTDGYVHQEGMIFSPDGHCRTFDADARGTVIGSGVGVVVLKRLAEALEDGDTVHAVIKGTAVNNDGSTKASYTAPSVERQAAVVREAQRLADCPAESIGYVEAHGTGTPLGDPIEVAALTLAFGPGAGAGRTALGSVKTNVGHLDTAAGMAGLIKTALMLRHRTLVPSLHFRTPNPDIDFAAGPFTVATQTAPWPDGAGPRRAGVSSFGVGGTNAHVILQEPPQPPPAPRPGGAELLLLSARTPEALARTTDALSRHLRDRPGPDLTAVAHTLAAGRRPHACRRAVVCSDAKDAALALAILGPDRVLTGPAGEAPGRFAFVLPGDAGGPAADGTELYHRLPAFRAAVEACAAALDGDPDPEALLTSRHGAGLAAFVTQYALATACREANVAPSAFVGTGVGRAVAGCLAGVLPLRDALALVTDRAPAATPSWAEPGLPVALNTGAELRWLRPDEATDPRRWAPSGTAEDDGQATAALLKEADLIPLDFAGPGRTAAQTLLHALGQAWVHGADVDWSGWYGPGRQRRVPLPTYPFERRRHWVDRPSLRAVDRSSLTSAHGTGALRRRIEEADDAGRGALLADFIRLQVADVLEEQGDRMPGMDDDLFQLGVDSLILIDIIARLGTELDRPVEPSLDGAPTIRGIAEDIAAAWHTGPATTGRHG